MLVVGWLLTVCTCRQVRWESAIADSRDLIVTNSEYIESVMNPWLEKISLHTTELASLHAASARLSNAAEDIDALKSAKDAQVWLVGCGLLVVC